MLLCPKSSSSHCRRSCTTNANRCLIVILCVTSLPLISLFTARPRSAHPAASAQIPLPAMTSSLRPEVDCVATASRRGRLIGQKHMSAGRLGNDMFVYASLLGISAMNRMVPIMHCDALARTFHVTATGSYVIQKPAVSVTEESCFRYVSSISGYTT